MKKEDLIKKKDNLIRELQEVTNELDKLDERIYKGKFEKAIVLLKQCLDYLSDPTIKAQCPDCRHCVDIDLDYIIRRLEALLREEFK